MEGDAIRLMFRLCAELANTFPSALVATISSGLVWLGAWVDIKRVPRGRSLQRTGEESTAPLLAPK
jgi:hypothetical protein